MRVLLGQWVAYALYISEPPTHPTHLDNHIQTLARWRARAVVGVLTKAPDVNTNYPDNHTPSEKKKTKIVGGLLPKPTRDLLVRVLSAQWVAYILYLSENIHLPTQPP